MRSLFRWLRVQSSALRHRGRRRRRLVGAGTAVAAAAFAVFMITNALAVHDEKFELDGNITTQGETKFQKGTVDWESFFDASGKTVAPLPEGFTAAGFHRDFQTSGTKFSTADPTTYTTGSKDTLPISTGWECGPANNVLSKDDIMNAYATSYTTPTGEKILYFGLERNANNGDGNVGFWFLQDKNVECSSPKGNLPFKGEHHEGDLLVVSAFTKGGGVSTIKVFKWVGGATGELVETGVEGIDCTNKSLLGGDDTCATTNGSPEGINGAITTPWLTANKTDGVGHTLQSSEFFEGGLNLTKAKLAGKCFNTFIGDTRSSQSPTATLFDFDRGELGACESETETTPVQADGTTTFPSEGLPIPATGTLTVKDKAEVKVKGISEFKASVTFHLCGPFSASSTTSCATGGVPIGEAQSVTSTPTTLTSAAATITEAGRYCWRADFSGDSSVGVPPSSDSRSTECFLIKPLTPTLTTEAGRPSPVDFGNPVTDKATLVGTANEPGSGGPAGSIDGSINPKTAGGAAQGKITFTLYKDCATKALATGTGTNPQTVDVSGDKTYGPVSFTPDAPGTYHWVATYGGDLPNTTASDTTAEDATCGKDAKEDVEIRQIPTEMSTTQKAFPQDSTTINSTVSGDSLPSGGTVIFSLYGPTGGATPKTALENCKAHGETLNSGGLLYTETHNAVGGSHSVTVSTDNKTVPVNDTSPTTYFWRVTYAPGDTAHTGRQSDCVENVQVTFTNDPVPGTLFP